MSLPGALWRIGRRASSQEQARGIDQIAQAVASMDKATQSTAASARHGASSSSELMTQADELHAIVLQLRSLVGTDSARPSSASDDRQPTVTM